MEFLGALLVLGMFRVLYLICEIVDEKSKGR